MTHDNEIASIRLSHRKALRIDDEIHVTASVGLQSVEGLEFIGTDWCFIVDRSSSMMEDGYSTDSETDDGTSEENNMDLVQVYAKHLIDSMKVRDTLSLVSFGNHGKVEIPTEFATDEKKNEWEDILDNIPCGGQTDLGSGLQTAMEQIKALQHKEKRNVQVVIFCDGDVNRGERNVHALRTILSDGLTGYNNPTVSVFMIGEVENHQSKLLFKLAQKSKDNPSFPYYNGRFEMLLKQKRKETEASDPFILLSSISQIESTRKINLPPIQLTLQVIGMEGAEIFAGKSKKDKAVFLRSVKPVEQHKSRICFELSDFKKESVQEFRFTVLLPASRRVYHEFVKATFRFKPESEAAYPDGFKLPDGYKLPEDQVFTINREGTQKPKTPVREKMNDAKDDLAVGLHKAGKKAFKSVEKALEQFEFCSEELKEKIKTLRKEEADPKQKRTALEELEYWLEFARSKLKHVKENKDKMGELGLALYLQNLSRNVIDEAISMDTLDLLDESEASDLSPAQLAVVRKRKKDLQVIRPGLVRELKEAFEQNSEADENATRRKSMQAKFEALVSSGSSFLRRSLGRRRSVSSTSSSSSED